MNPAAEYSARLARRQSVRDSLQRLFVRLGNARLAIGICFAVLAWMVFAVNRAPLWSVFVPLAAFIALAVWHGRVVKERNLRERSIRFYQSGLDRLDDKWIGAGSPGEEFRIKDHVYADDLDVFGKGSLFELISRARTTMGDQTLATWLLQAAGEEEARARQAAVIELAARLDLREELFLLGSEVRTDLNATRLQHWAATPPEQFKRLLGPLAFLLAVAGALCLVLVFLHRLPLSVFVLLLVCDVLLYYPLRERVERTFEGLARASKDLEVLSLFLHRLERETFLSPRLREIAAALQIPGKPASARLAQLARIVAWVDSSEHLLVRLLSRFLLWKEQCAFAVDRWRIENRTHVTRWLQAVGDFEALLSLASLAYEHPEWAFPTLIPDDGGEFSARALRHPLIPVSRCIANDVSLGGPIRLLIISGSNMSGKSTLLRAIGLNTVLAWMGAPVAAQRLTVSPFQPGASIRIADSLQDNRSRFFAEITRLQQIMQLSNVRVLFLLDELLSGTNSHDRRAGAAAVVKTLVERGAIGCITTHDLALAEIERDLHGAAVNAHFEDQMNDGRMTFDYQLRPGIVTHSNALELMRAIGLPV